MLNGKSLWIAAGLLLTLNVTSSVFADDVPHPNTYIPTLPQVKEHKAMFDDPRPYLSTFGPKQVLPPELYKKLSFDVKTMQDRWAELVGFRAPEKVGKIAPEIKPGKYTYQDVRNNPAFKDLMFADLYNRIKPGGPPHAGSIPEFEIVPTRQYYWSLPIAEQTKANIGKTKMDEKGYLKYDTWIAGYPFPKPEGKFKGQQIMYNLEKRYLSWGLNFYIISQLLGFDKNFTVDFDGIYTVSHIRYAGRVHVPPFGWLDDRARTRGEFKQFILGFLAPRDVYGAAQSALYYADPLEQDQLMMYLPSMRRIRKLSATDSQDPVMGQDQIYDDNEGWMQKLSPNRYPYEYEVIEEREYLVPAPTQDGSEYITSEGLEFRGLRFERRPMYVIKLTQKDSNYVYGHRIFYVDAETFNFLHIENYDQKGRLYRTWDGNYSFFPEMGIFSWSGSLILMRDHIDTHSGAQQPYQIPAFWDRSDISLKGVMGMAK
jgi:hypothetical protein